MRNIDDITHLLGLLSQPAIRTGRLADGVATAGATMRDSLSDGHTIFAFGNGGSAAQAQHFAAELVGRFRAERSGLSAVALTADTAAITALGNDYGFERVFARQIEALGRPGDVAFAISTSGRSDNVLRGLAAARENSLRTIGLCGQVHQPFVELCDVVLRTPAPETARVQELHLMIVHALCAILEPEAEAELEHAVVVSLDELLELRRVWRQASMEVVWTNGCFDLLHAGHVDSIQRAARLGDVLVVGVNSDASVSRLKGQGRPFVPAESRARTVAAIKGVDRVVVFEDDTPERVLSLLKPEIHVKGEEYANGCKPIPEEALVRSYGGRVEFLPHVETLSTTQIMQRIRQ
jgi:rfaE bifunctional protein nucleotidyltransferase chain/domain